MKVILNHDVAGLGEEGDIRDVATGGTHSPGDSFWRWFVGTGRNSYRHCQTSKKATQHTKRK